MKSLFYLLMILVMFASPVTNVWAGRRFGGHMGGRSVSSSRPSPSMHRSSPSFSSSRHVPSGWGPSTSGSSRAPSFSRRGSSSFPTQSRGGSFYSGFSRSPSYSSSRRIDPSYSGSGRFIPSNGYSGRSGRSSPSYPTYAPSSYSSPNFLRSGSVSRGRPSVKAPGRRSTGSDSVAPNRPSLSPTWGSGSRSIAPVASPRQSAPTYNWNRVNRPSVSPRSSSTATPHFSRPATKNSLREQWWQNRPAPVRPEKVAPVSRPSRNPRIDKPSILTAPLTPTVRHGNSPGSAVLNPAFKGGTSAYHPGSVNKPRTAPPQPAKNGPSLNPSHRKTPFGLQWQNKTPVSRPIQKPSYSGPKGSRPENVRRNPSHSPSVAPRVHERGNKPIGLGDSPGNRTSKLRDKNSQSIPFRIYRDRSKSWTQNSITRPSDRDKSGSRYPNHFRSGNESRPHSTGYRPGIGTHIGYRNPNERLKRYRFKDPGRNNRPSDSISQNRHVFGERKDPYNRWGRDYSRRRHGYSDDYYNRWYGHYPYYPRHGHHHHHHHHHDYYEDVHYHYHCHDHHYYGGYYPWGFSCGHWGPGWGYSSWSYSCWDDGWYGGIAYVVNPWHAYRTVYYYPQTTYVEVPQTTYVQTAPSTTYVSPTAPAEYGEPPASSGNELIGVNGKIIDLAPPADQAAQSTAAPVVAPFATPAPIAPQGRPLAPRQNKTGKSEKQKGETPSVFHPCTCLCNCGGIRPCTCEYPCGSEYLLTKEFCRLNFVPIFETFDPEIILQAYFEGDLFEERPGPDEDSFEDTDELY